MVSTDPYKIKLAEVEARLSEKLDNLIERFDAVSNGIGFPRCSDRAARLLAVEREIAELKRLNEGAVSKAEFNQLARSYTWLRNVFVGLLLAGICSGITIKLIGG